jgi:crotonobetainyl-CoA:carnitine CoA-transferase CaiB-like acyl-CoA transferase
MSLPSAPSRPLPYEGLRVVEFTHMVMGPTCGMVLADLGAEVIKIEPIAGDNTRRLLGGGAGFYPLFNRNKKSVSVDINDPRGREFLLRLVGTADVFSENFKPGSLDRHGFGWSALSALNPRLVYVSHKGFLPGPYDHRTALDEVVQMMGGLAYMTGPAGRPLRAGTSVNDIMGGMFGAIGVMAALAQRDKTGLGQQVQSALFENNVFLVAQSMMQYAVTGVPVQPMPERKSSAWGIYDVFTVRDGAQIFLAAVSDTQWEIFCRAFGYADLFADERLRTNNLRVKARDWMLPLLRERLAMMPVNEIVEIFEREALPFAPITRPEELFDDPHLNATGGLSPMTIPADGSAAGHEIQTKAALLPIALDGQRLALRTPPPRLGEHTAALMRSVGYDDSTIAALAKAGVVRCLDGTLRDDD